MQARVSFSDAPTLAAAVQEILERWEPPSGGEAAGCDLALVLVGTAHGRFDASIGHAIGARLTARHTAVAQVEGLLGPDTEWLARPALAVLEVSGDVAVHSVDHARGREREVGDELAACLGPLSEDDVVLAIADAHDLDARSLAEGLAACAPASILGVGVEGVGGSHASHALDGEVATSGVLGVRMRASSKLRCAVAPGVRLRAERKVDEVRGNWLYALSGASALEEFRDAAGVLWNDEQRARRSVFVALPDLPEQSGAVGGEPHAALARAVVGTDEELGAIALAEPVAAGARVAFALRDSAAASEALSSAARQLGAIAPSGAHAGLGLVASCPSRGEALFGHAGLEAGYFASAFGFAPWVGLIGSVQIAGTPGSPARLLTHAAALVRLV